MIKATKCLCKHLSCIRSMPVLQICKESKLKSGKWFGTSVFNLEQHVWNESVFSADIQSTSCRGSNEWDWEVGGCLSFSALNLNWNVKQLSYFDCLRYICKTISYTNQFLSPFRQTALHWYQCNTPGSHNAYVITDDFETNKVMEV